MVVGGSVAGVNAAEGARRAGWTGDICLLEAQAAAPYDRPPLSKQLLAGEWQPEQIHLRPEAFWKEMEIYVRAGVHVDRLEQDEDLLVTREGERIPFSGLVVATGCSARTLGTIPLGPRVFSLRTLEDSLRLQDALQAARSVVIVGGGFIGLEVAAHCAKGGLTVAVVDVDPLPLQSRIGEVGASKLLDVHAGAGVEFYSGRTVAASAETDEGLRVELSDGAVIDADIALVCVGVVPDVAWLNGSGIAVDRGVVCDEMLGTTRERVYAAGDLASWLNPTFAGERMRVEHWTTAREQGIAAGANVSLDLLARTGDREAFAHVPYVWSDQYQHKIQIVGSFTGSDEIHVEESDGDALVLSYHRAGELRGAFCLNSVRQAMRFRRTVRAAVVS
ncbi:NAD(P)/FAD-dependent oxidoreductase [Nocardioides sp. AN3]